MLAEVKEKGKINKDSAKTLNQVYKEFLELGANEYQANSITLTSRHYNKHIKDKLGHIAIKNIDYALLQKYFNNRGNISITTIKHVKDVLSRIIKYAIKVDYINNNPTNLVKVVGIEKTNDKDQIVLDKELNILINELESKNDFTKKVYSIAIQIGKYTDLRISEVFALEKEDICFDENCIKVNRKLVYVGLKKDKIYTTHQIKSKKSKAIIPLVTILKNILTDWFKINPYDHVICDIDGNLIHPTYFNNVITYITDIHGFHFNFHMLRHTHATTLFTNNVDVKTTQDLLRHSSFNTTMDVYTHISNDHKSNVVNDIFSLKNVEKVSKTNDETKALN